MVIGEMYLNEAHVIRGALEEKTEEKGENLRFGVAGIKVLYPFLKHHHRHEKKYRYRASDI